MDTVAFVEPDAHAYPAVHGPAHDAFGKPVVSPYLPALHGPLHDAVESPVVFPNRPAAQLLHTAAPATLYEPTPHIAAVALVEPAMQA